MMRSLTSNEHGFCVLEAYFSNYYHSWQFFLIIWFMVILAYWMSFIGDLQKLMVGLRPTQLLQIPSLSWFYVNICFSSLATIIYLHVNCLTSFECLLLILYVIHCSSKSSWPCVKYHLQKDVCYSFFGFWFRFQHSFPIFPALDSFVD
jgi:hypothetical protein